MNSSDAATAAIIAGIFGLIGGGITIPINMLVNFVLKRDEINQQHRLDRVNKIQELKYQHDLKVEEIKLENEYSQNKDRILKIEERLKQLEEVFINGL